MSFYVSHPAGFNQEYGKRAINFVVLAEGFFPHREGVFLMHVDSFARTLLRTRPFDRFTSLMSVSAIFVPATVSLAHLKPGQECDWRSVPLPDGSLPGEDHEFGTPFGALFCRGRDYRQRLLPRVLTGNLTAVWDAVRAEPSLAGLVCHPLVLVDNDQVHGGAAGGFSKGSPNQPRAGWFTLYGDWIGTAIHELGHSVFGLADEYDYEGPPSHAGNEPAEPNITISATRDALLAAAATTSSGKRSLHVWGHLLRPSTPVPTSESNPGCVPQPDQESKVVLPGGQVGMFEGGHYSACNVYRPRLWCKMRHSGLSWFCEVCEWAIADTFARVQTPLQQHATQTIAGTWTHVLCYEEPSPPANMIPSVPTRYFFYNPLGYYVVMMSDPYTTFGVYYKELNPPAAQIDGGWSSLALFFFNGSPHIAAYSLLFRRFGIYEIETQGTTSQAVLRFDSGVGGFPFTQFALFTSRGVAHVIGYESATGALAISRVDDPTAAPALVYGTLQDPSRRWTKGMSLIVPLTIEGVPYVLRHNATTGEVQIQSLDPPGFGPMTFVSEVAHWWPGATVADAYVSNGRTYVARASTGSYRAIDWVWPDGAGMSNLVLEPGLDLTLAFSYWRTTTNLNMPMEALIALSAGSQLQFLHGT